jgi:hypothetical protein
MAGKELAAAGLADIPRQTHDALLQIDWDTSRSRIISRVLIVSPTRCVDESVLAPMNTRYRSSKSDQ